MKKISIITPLLNSKDTITCCIESVKSQTYTFKEHIIVDGGSSDGSLEIIGKYETDDFKILSRKDKGLYDAINEGISIASGEIIAVLNSDDFYADETALEKVMSLFNFSDEIEAVYGDLAYVDCNDENKIIRYWQAGKYNSKNFYYGWMPPHPSTFFPKSLYEKFGTYRLDLGTAADYELLLRFLLINNVKTVYLPKLLLYMRTGGVSNVSLKNRFKANIMDSKAWEVNNLKPYFFTLMLKPLRKIIQYFRKP